MSDKKIIAVMGATGAQGGGLVRAILNDPDKTFAVRAITRDTNSEKAKELAKLGAEVVAADIDDEKSLEKAFAGAYGAYCVTFYWAHFSPEKEFNHAVNMAKAAKQAGVQHVIWSTLEDSRKFIPLEDNRMPTLMGKYKVPHFDAKGEADQVYSDLELPVTFLATSFYWENFIFFGMGPKKNPDGTYTIAIPIGDKKLPGISAEDIGKCALGIFKQGKELIGKTVGIAGEHLTGYQMVDTFSKVLGKDIKYYPVAPDVYRGFGFPGADDLGNMFQFNSEFEKEFCEVRNLKATRSLNPSLLTFEQWVSINKDRIPLG